MKRIVGVFAHPSDESVMCGGTLAKYAKAGASVDIICAAHTPETKIAMERATSVLGVSSLTFLDYKEGTVARQNPGEIEDQLFRAFVDFAPTTVITFEPDGVNNDPEHKKITVAATVAFQNYAATSREVIEKNISPTNRPRHPRDVWQISFAEAIRNEKDATLYYVCMPSSIAEYLKKEEAIPAVSFDRPWRGVADKTITTVIDIAQSAPAKKQALAAFGTTGYGDALLRQEFFVLRMHGTKEVFMGKDDRVSNRL